jgi:hypothetical protein
MTSRKNRVLKVELYTPQRSPGEDCSGFCSDLYVLGTQNTWALLFKSFLLFRRISQYELVITNEYFSSFGLNLRLLVTRCRTKHAIVGLNQSRRLLRTDIPWIDSMVNYVFKRSDLVIVHSRSEVELFNRRHEIPRSRFFFSLWGYDPPQIASTRFARWPRKYVCSVGRNNRDFATFCEACEGLEVDGIIITSGSASLPEGIPPNIYVFRELSTDETLDCIRNATASVILLKDDSRGAGHITAVATMFIGTPQIVSDADVLRDYFIDGVTTLSVHPGDMMSVRAAIERVSQEPDLRRQLIKNAKNYADQWLTDKSASQRICFALKSLLAGKPLMTVDPVWLNVYETLRSQVERD